MIGAYRPLELARLVNAYLVVAAVAEIGRDTVDRYSCSDVIFKKFPRFFQSFPEFALFRQFYFFVSARYGAEIFDRQIVSVYCFHIASLVVVFHS